MDSLVGYVATIVVALIVGYLSQFLQPRSKLLCWLPHNFTFELKKEGLVLVANSLTVQNVGRQAAEDIEIIHKSRPDFFQLSPAVAFEESTTPNDEHVIRLKALGPKEWVFLQLLSYKTVPVLQNVRSKDGQGQFIAIQPQRVFPRWRIVTLQLLFIVGAGTVAYWLIRSGIFVFHQAGLFK
jgi:hypothetical protein